MRLIAVACLMLGMSVSAEVKVPSLFSDGMVLQQKMKVPVWGWGRAGEDVAVTFGSQNKTGKVGADGKWMVKLEPLQASAESAQLSIKVGDETKVINDVVVGEVWLCSGQSNMEYSLRQLAGNARESKYQPVSDLLSAEIATAEDRLLRQMTVSRNVSFYEAQEEVKGNWIKSGPEHNGGFTGTGYFFAKKLRKELNVPVALIRAAYSGSRIEPWIPMQSYQQNAELKAYYDQNHNNIKKAVARWDENKALAAYQEKLKKWKEDKKNAQSSGKKFSARAPRRPVRADKSKQLPSTLFNGMINPLIPYAMKGAIWYQGESNSNHCTDQYLERFTLMINSWRQLWKQGDFPFYYAQLANFQQPGSELKYNDGWISVCNQQRLAMSINNTGMAVLNDIGEARDIHPKNKIDVGTRLALWALAKDYGLDIVYSGPLYQDCVFKGSTATVSFSCVGKGLIVGKKNLVNPVAEVTEPLKGFEICGSDGVWKSADAEILGTNQVKVSHPEITTPTDVRYAWAKYSLGANLYNKDGLPASLFIVR